MRSVCQVMLALALRSRQRPSLTSAHFSSVPYYPKRYGSRPIRPYAPPLPSALTPHALVRVASRSTFSAQLLARSRPQVSTPHARGGSPIISMTVSPSRSRRGSSLEGAGLDPVREPWAKAWPPWPPRLLGCSAALCRCAKALRPTLPLRPP